MSAMENVISCTYVILMTAHIKGTSLCAGADVRKDDGTYSRYFTAYNNNGAYSIRVEVKGENGKAMLNKRVRSYAQGAPPLPAYRGKPRPIHARLLR